MVLFLYVNCGVSRIFKMCGVIKNLPPLFYLNCGGRPFITRAYNPDNYFSSSSSRLVILFKLIARVEALWNSAEVVG